MSNELNINAIGGGRPSRRRALMMMQSRGYIVNWNQLVYNGNNVGTTNIIFYGSTGEIIADNTMKVTPIEGSSYGCRIYYIVPNFIRNDIYLLTMNHKEEGSGVFSILGESSFYIIKNAPISPNWDRFTYRFACSGNGAPALNLKRESPVDVNYYQKVQLFNLTQMFGSGNEPPTVAQFESWLQENGINPNEYIPYNAGEERTMTKPSWL